ncbi:hypothetical protein HYD_1890 [Candidatus Hydrogenosomobacter endosymbioticus]|uniref:Uncharacterized protein n=1 Tax=Candidatus Hydrogenosomobacter endosymbioticus TaxID=2558174 RepID=A0ABM7V9A9_9PROT|nr:hypothetical protein HYD_1890 [Candidatus Hydrogenosomobacter endosymbioticus]
MIDAYPHKDTIKELFEADDPLSQGLSSRGFVIAEKSFANYPFTPMSVSSQLMCEYYSDNENLAWSVIRGGKSNVVRTFMKNGYNIYLNVGKISNSASLHETLLNMLSQTILTSVVKLSHFVQYLEPIDIVQFIRDRNSGGSNFVYAHFFQVHDNAVTDERGKIVTHEFEMVLDDNRSHFMKSIKDFSQKFLALIDEIRLRDKSAVVLVNSDHGLPVFIGNDFSRKDFLFMKNARHGELIQLWFKTAICAIKKVKDGGMSDIWKYRQKNFVGVFVPVDSDNLKNSVKASEFANPISNINLFRVLFSHLGIKNLPKISDEVFVSTLAAKKGGHAEFKLIKAPYIRDSLYKNGNKNKK